MEENKTWSHMPWNPSENNMNNNNGDDEQTIPDVIHRDSADTFDIKFFNKHITVNVSKNIERTVINLSSNNLMQSDISVLWKGLKFHKIRLIHQTGK